MFPLVKSQGKFVKKSPKLHRKFHGDANQHLLFLSDIHPIGEGAGILSLDVLLRTDLRCALEN
jgi:hypothetical protein